jgi:hypothetical protein
MPKRSAQQKRSRTATPVHHLRAKSNELDSIGIVWLLDDDTKMFSQGSATGPLDPIYEDKGELKVGTKLFLAFDYDYDDYVERLSTDSYKKYLIGEVRETKPGWPCEVVRVNVKTVTVKSLVTQELHRIFI